MLLNFIFFLIFVFSVYFYAIHRTEITETALAIQQVWSGECRLTCRQNQRTGSRFAVIGSQHAVPSSSCICQTCPCGLVENFLRSCSPVSDICRNILDNLSVYYYYLLELECPSSGNFNFEERPAPAPSPTPLRRMYRSLTSERRGHDETVVFGPSEPSRGSPAPSLGTLSDKGTCSKCSAKGKTCMAACPKAKKKK